MNDKRTILNNTHWEIVAVVMACILALSVALFVSPGPVSSAIEAFKTSAIDVLTPFYLWLGIAVVGFLVWVCLSKYGNIRLGHEKPEFKTFSWIAMMFCAGMGSSLLYWSCVEWIYYYSAPPMGAEPFSQFAAELSQTYGSFHWSITAWSLYVVGAVALCIRFHVHKKPELSLSACVAGFIGEHHVHSALGKIIDIIFLLGLLAGQCATLCFGVPMFCDNFSAITGIPVSFGLNVAMMIAVTLVFSVTSWLGLGKGMKNLSTWTAYCAIAMAFYFLIAGPTEFQLNVFTDSMGYMFQNFLHMSLWTDPIANSGFPESWTAFYWAWWLSLGPWVWVYTCRISKGRTIRDVILGMVLCGSAGSWLYFGTVSPFGLFQEMNGNVPLSTILAEQGAPAATSALVKSMPGGSILLIIWLFVGITLLATSLDSVTFTLTATTTKHLGQEEEPNRIMRLIWAGVMISVPLGFMFADAPLSAVQSAAFLTAIPIGVLCIFSMIAAVKYFKRDFGAMSASEITQAGQDPSFIPVSIKQESNSL